MIWGEKSENGDMTADSRPIKGKKYVLECHWHLYQATPEAICLSLGFSIKGDIESIIGIKPILARFVVPCLEVYKTI